MKYNDATQKIGFINPSRNIEFEVFKGEERIQLPIQKESNNQDVTFNDFLQVLKKLLVKLKNFLLKKIMEIKDKYDINLSKIPVLQLLTLGLVVLLFTKKDFQFNMKTNSPFAFIKDKNDKNELKTTKNSIAHLASFKDTSNPFAPANPATLKDKETLQYLKRFGDVAVVEMHKFGIPASIKLAQGIIESRSGHSTLAVKNNNHFGMKCFSKKCKKGHCANFHDDNHKDFFRKYSSAWESWRSHSKMIVSGRYKKLLKYKNDYKNWALGLQSAGYATDKRYADKLIAVINKYQLYEYDKK